MTNEGSLQAEASQFAFDLDSQKGVTILLASIRVAEISPEQKNELRDLVFLYANGGRDESVRITIEQKVVAYGVEMAPNLKLATPAEVVVAEKPRPAFGTSRPAPSFTPTSVKVIATPDVVKVEEKAIPFKVEVSVPKPAEIPKAEIEVPLPTPEPVIVVTPEPVSTPEPVFAPTPEPIVAPAPIPEPVQPPAAEAVAYDSAQSLQRIREIKSIVNDKVGNPVNLVDIDNEVGREYMGALLDAMKKINSGSSAISAMKRLEASFIEVQKTIEKHNQIAVEATPEPVSTPVPDIQELIRPEVVETTPTPISIPEPTPVPEPTPMLEPVFAPTPEPIVAPTPIPEPTPEPVPAPEVKFEERPSNLPIQEIPKIEAKEMNAAVVESRESAWGQTSNDEEVKTESRIPITKISSLGDSKVKPTSIDKLPTAASLESSSVQGDALFTKQVDDGLSQLLQEWSIFKKSGLFGTGPKGSEHPLFKKIATLQIPLLLAGRFEGATQEIKQSITDYMNGWRYEQGIIYEQGETFEHYLRRVIRHILDLQKNK